MNTPSPRRKRSLWRKDGPVLAESPALLALVASSASIAGVTAWSSLKRKHPALGRLIDVEGRAMRSELPRLSSNGRMITAVQSGHNAHLQQPRPVVEAVRDILNATRRRADDGHAPVRNKGMKAARRGRGRLSGMFTQPALY